MHGVRSRPSSRPSGMKRERSPGIFQRLKGSEFLSSAEIPQIRGPWTSYESVLSGSVMKVITLTNVEPSPENISTLHNFVVSSNNVNNVNLEKMGFNVEKHGFLRVDGN